MTERVEYPPELAELAKRGNSPDRVLARHKYSSYAVFVPFVRKEGETHWLFEVRSQEIRQGGEVCFPGGGVETQEGELPENAAVRETAEELGLGPEQVGLAGYLGHLWTHWGGIIDVFYGTLHCPLSQLQPRAGEVEEVFTVPLSFFHRAKPAVHHFQQIVQPASGKEGSPPLPWKEWGLSPHYAKPRALRTYPVFFYTYAGRTIWGITADIILEVLSVLKNPPNGVH